MHGVRITFRNYPASPRSDHPQPEREARYEADSKCPSAGNQPTCHSHEATHALEAAIDALMERASTLPDEAVTKAWAATKLAGFLPVLPAFAAAMFGTLPLDTAANRRRAAAAGSPLGE